MSSKIATILHLSPPFGTEQLPNSATVSMVQDVLVSEEVSQRDLVSQQAKMADYRQNSRKKFTSVQLIAPYDGRQMPSQVDFQPQLCHDLSPTGFSFWQQQPCTATQLIVALGEVPFLFFIAEIVHQAYEPHSEPGGWRIGCRFIRRVDR